MKKLQGVSAYQDISAGSGIDSASPRRLVQMLLDGALNRIATAKGHIQRQESARKGEQIGKAISIIDGLRVSLNPEAGELSENLGNLYEYISGRLLEANLNDNVAVLDEVAGLLREIKSAWDVLAAEEYASSSDSQGVPA